MTIRDIRQRWPEAEKALANEGEIIVTRDSKPVARLLPFVPAAQKPRKRFNAEAHMRWLKRASENDPPEMRSSGELLHEMRNQGHPLAPTKA